jgi:hypothetical protein
MEKKRKEALLWTLEIQAVLLTVSQTMNEETKDDRHAESVENQATSRYSPVGKGARTR